jgi:hypothetical protein
MFPSLFGLRPGRAYTFLGFQFMFVMLMLAYAAIFFTFKLAVGEDLPAAAAVIVAPLLIAGYSWLFSSGRSLTEIGVMVSVLVALGAVWYWIRT